MIVPVRHWTLVRPIRLAMRARRVQKNRSTEAPIHRQRESLMTQFSSMLEHQANLMFKEFTKE